MVVRPRRSVLYMPGANARAMEKARDLPADALIFDLEDAVAPAKKETARRQVIETLQKGGYGNRELVVRVNGLMTPWGGRRSGNGHRRRPRVAYSKGREQADYQWRRGAHASRTGAGRDVDMVHDRNTEGRHAGGRDRFRLATSRCAGDGDVRPRKGFALSAHAVAGTVHDKLVVVHIGSAGERFVYLGRGASRSCR